MTKLISDIRKRISINFDKWDIGLLAVCLGFYLFFPFYDGAIWCKDSLSYVNMNLSREPVYPTFLWIFRQLFGEKNYLMPVVVAQSLLAAYATWKLALTVKEYKNGSNLLAVLSVGFQFVVTFLCRFVANRGSSYTDSIMTEGLGLSLYILFIIQLFKYIMGGGKKNLAGAVFLSLILINLRRQMLITLCLMSALSVLYYAVKNKNSKKILLLFVLIAGVFLASKMTERLYNHWVRDAWVEHAGNSRATLCTLIYTSDEKDAALFEDQELRGFYEEILKRADEQKLRIKYAPKGWVDLSTHYADSYDAIGYGIINPVIQEYIADKYNYTDVDAALKYDDYCNDIAKILFGQDKTDLIRVYASNTWKGFVNSIARVHPILNKYAIFAYILYILSYIKVARLHKKEKNMNATLTFAEIILGAVIVNSMVVGIMIFAQPRYMIYNMGLFYSALSILLYDVIINKYGKTINKD